MVNLAGYKLTFDDEFNIRSISQAGSRTTWSDIRPQWRFDANSDIGFGTSSFVDATSGYDPFSVSGGALSITAVPDRTTSGYPGSEESGLISTEGSFSQTYGYFEMRAQTSGAPGSWDAFWMLPDQPAANPTNAPGWQELDVVEHYGGNDKGVYSTIHTTDQTPNIPWQDNRQVYSETPGLSTGYHTYGMDWEPDRISFYVDGNLMGSQATPSDMHGPMYLLADLATQSSASSSPMTTKIDYIRAYSKDPSATAVSQDVVSAPDGHDPGLYGATAATAIVATAPTISAPTATSPAATTALVTSTDTPLPQTADPNTTPVIASSQPVMSADPTAVDPSGAAETATAAAAQSLIGPTSTTAQDDITALANTAWNMPAISQHGDLAVATMRLMSVLQHDSAVLGEGASFNDVASNAYSYLTDHPGYGLAVTLLQGVMSGHDAGPVSDLANSLATDQNFHVFTAMTGYHLGHTSSQSGA
ncbi:MAG: glycoside hydrolase family 16 protein [Janthinobacterium lividum]